MHTCAWVSFTHRTCIPIPFAKKLQLHPINFLTVTAAAHRYISRTKTAAVHQYLFRTEPAAALQRSSRNRIPAPRPSSSGSSRQGVHGRDGNWQARSRDFLSINQSISQCKPSGWSAILVIREFSRKRSYSGAGAAAHPLAKEWLHFIFI